MRKLRGVQCLQLVNTPRIVRSQLMHISYCLIQFAETRELGVLLVATAGYSNQHEYHPDNYHDTVFNNDIHHNGDVDKYNLKHGDRHFNNHIDDHSNSHDIYKHHNFNDLPHHVHDHDIHDINHIEFFELYQLFNNHTDFYDYNKCYIDVFEYDKYEHDDHIFLLSVKHQHHQFDNNYQFLGDQHNNFNRDDHHNKPFYDYKFHQCFIDDDDVVNFYVVHHHYKHRNH